MRGSRPAVDGYGGLAARGQRSHLVIRHPRGSSAAMPWRSHLSRSRAGGSSPDDRCRDGHRRARRSVRVVRGAALGGQIAEPGCPRTTLRAGGGIAGPADGRTVSRRGSHCFESCSAADVRVAGVRRPFLTAGASGRSCNSLARRPPAPRVVALASLSVAAHGGLPSREP